MLQGLVNKVIEEKLNSVEFEDRLFWKSEKATTIKPARKEEDGWHV